MIRVVIGTQGFACEIVAESLKGQAAPVLPEEPYCQDDSSLQRVIAARILVVFLQDADSRIRHSEMESH